MKGYRKEKPFLTLPSLGGGVNSSLIATTGGDALSEKYFHTHLRPSFGTSVDKQRVAVDNSGNIFVSGSEKPSSGLSSGLEGTVFAKYNRSGVLQWQRFLSYLSTYSGEYIYMEKLATDSGGNLYGAGWGAFGSGDEGILVKYNPSGVLQWQIKFGNSNYMDRCYGMDVDDAGNVYIATMTFDTGVSGSYLPEDASVIAKFNSSGTLQWQVYFGGDSGTGDLDAESIKVDSNGDIFVSGTRENAGGTGVVGAFLVKFNSSGTLQWQRDLVASTTSRFYGVDVDSSGNSYIAGYIEISNVAHGMVVKYNSSGTLQWQKTLGNTSYPAYFYDIAVDKYSNIYTTGSISNISYPDASGTTNDVLITKWDSSGNLQWQRTYGRPTYVSTNYEQARNIEVDRSGNIYVAAQLNVPQRDTYFYSNGGTGLSVIKLPSDGTKTGMYESQWYRISTYLTAASGSSTSSTTSSSSGTSNQTSSTLTLTEAARTNTSVTVMISDATETTEINTNGLDFHIDAGNTSSYSGTGTTVNSLVGSITSSSFNSNIEYSPDNGGHFVFDWGYTSSNQTGYGMSFDGTFADITGTVSFSYDFWIRYSYFSTSNFVAVGFQKSNQTAGNSSGSTSEHLQYWGGYGTGSSDIAYFFLWSWHATQGQVGSAPAFTPITDSSGSSAGNGKNWVGNNDWWHIAVVNDPSNDTRKVYANGSEIYTNTSSTEFDSIRTLTGTPRIYIGGFPQESGINGDIAVFRFYKDITLQPSEVLQNFNAEKTRFGLNYS